MTLEQLVHDPRPPVRTGRPPQATVMDLATGYWKTQVTFVLAELAIPDLIGDSKLTAEQVAAATDCPTDPVARLLRAAASLGLLASNDGGAFGLTETGQCLRSDRATSVRSLVRLSGTEHYLGWSRLLDCVRTGRPQLEPALGITSWWGYLHDHPERSMLFDQAMAELSRSSQAPALARFDFGTVRRLVDVGGGTGTLIARLLATHPRLTGVLFDRPEVVANAGPVLAEAGVRNRCEVVGGNMFDSVPTGADAYLLCSMLHDYADADARRILDNIRAAVEPGARLLLIEAVLPQGDAPYTGKLNDLNMMVMIDGRERTREEFAALLDQAGFRLLPGDPAPTPAQLLAAEAV